MARDVKLLIRNNKKTLEYLREILIKETELAEESQLISGVGCEFTIRTSICLFGINV